MYCYLKCNHVPKPIFAIEDVVYYGSDLHNAMLFEGDLLINLTSRPNIPSSLINIPELAEYVDVPFKEITVGWPDYGIPHLKLEFWQQLQKYIDKNGYKHVGFHCQAGHGRTGTALSAMLIANAGWSAKEAVEYVREAHCEDAVETNSQCRYLHVLDVFYNNADPDSDDLPEPPHKSYYSTYKYTEDDFKHGSSGVDNESKDEVSLQDEDGNVTVVDDEDIEPIELTEEDKIIFD